ncbi:rubrerythrin family protein [Sedimentibacter sp. zth1]|uniref:rubrerythrin n=1 Tax=Sedimentibacter sp. zth1 TaxID=2816908 RepID=UPI001A932BCC|nr:rubrerythrin family protein [Sedimentibacter sp. zth1]QSX04704.1 rubrerythrin family protein [Sedimentibacter sp. zth1]
MILLKDSKTKDNLMRAFAGESQARNRYTFAASQAKKENFAMIEHLFTYTANQEKEHAEIFYNFLKELSGQTIFVDGGYPVDIYPTTLELLKTSQHNEYEEWKVVYSDFSKIAKEEGFIKISEVFDNIGKIEKIHGDRFGKFANYLETRKIFESFAEQSWICLNCGNVHVGKTPPEICPVCNHPKGYYIRIEESPFE